MEDPFVTLVNALQPLFNSAVIRNNGKYTIEPIQSLKDAIEAYRPHVKVSYFALQRAIGNCAPYCTQRNIQFHEVIDSMNELAKRHGINRIEWNLVLQQNNLSVRLQFIGHANNQKSLIQWISQQSRRPFNQLGAFEKVQVLADHSTQQGFSYKLRSHLEKHPDFLFQLAKKSAQNFQKIAGCRLNLYLTDKQLALAIMKHLPVLCEDLVGTTSLTEQLTQKIDGMLSNGRSVNALCRNTDAQEILERSEYFADLFKSDDADSNYSPPFGS